MIHTERREHTLVVTIDRQERRNAVDVDSLDAMRDVFGSLDETVRVVVLTGAGGHFCSGADLGAVKDRGFARSVRSTLDALVALPVPTIASVSGFALGAGTQFASACDLRVATETARFGVPAVRLGLMVDEWTVRRVAELMGPSLARAVLLGAETVDLERALSSGFVHREGSLEDALDWAAELGAFAPLSIAGHKLALEAAGGPSGTAEVEAAIERAWTSDDFAEGISAFADRRIPRFTGS
ncbi:MAG TPA: enoyl-CoA hydratase-related protein [Acidimicrobiales bacterium]|nr:enoyl-CoA hydratase-related protein [Acidimicrobiales bacterium]